MLYNKKNKDGSVNSFQDTGTPGSGYTVPFSDSKFLDQIEENILPAVLNLNTKGYPTITSCHGHSILNYIFNQGIDINAGPSITIRVHKTLVPYLETHFKNFFIKTVVNDSMEEFDEVINLRIVSRFFISLFFTNRFLCRQIEIKTNTL